ncbi:MAG: aspartate--tRNA ligase [Bacillota bacterium]|nr:aspartate--tRNA ligase [Bacillota bacterium]
MEELLQGWKRTSCCGEIRMEDVGKKATLMGWAAKRRDLGGLIFVDLRDRSGVAQIVFDQSRSPENFKKAERIRSEYVIAVKGSIVKRDKETVNPKIPTGEVELKVEEFKILSTAETPPFYIEDGITANENVRLKYRYLDLRRPEMQANIMMRHKVAQITRKYMDDNGFLEIETPMLTKSTPEGARDYLVPSRLHPGKFFALPQSPQLFKQLFMVSGLDRYYQIVRCFRDEDLRSDRQPEFTQIDMEMSFVEPADVLEINEGLICRIFEEAIGVKLKRPFRRLTWEEAMSRYGSDKPDTRFGLELTDISELVKDCGFNVFASAVKNGGSVRGINAKGGAAVFARRELDALVEFVKTYGAKGLAWVTITEEGLKSPITKFFSGEQMDKIIARMGGEKGDVIFFVADKNKVVFDSLGALRLELAQRLKLIDYSRFDVLWVNEFPLLEYDEQEKRFVACHHPFTSPMDEDIALLESDPCRARAKSYDIIINGCEIGGGSVRIHSRKLQEKMFSLLGFDKETAWARFGFLLEAFKYGAPPHGGIAYGLDRLVMLLCGKSSIRDVIAFPKVQNSSCPMTDAPSDVDAKQLKELHIRTDT